MFYLVDLIFIPRVVVLFYLWFRVNQGCLKLTLSHYSPLSKMSSRHLCLRFINKIQFVVRRSELRRHVPGRHVPGRHMRCDRTFHDKFCSAFISDMSGGGRLASGVCLLEARLRHTVYLLGGWLRHTVNLLADLRSLMRPIRRCSNGLSWILPGSPSLDSRTPLLTPIVTKSTRTKFDGHIRLNKVAKVLGMCSGHTRGH
jgi:hypothetical protein